MSKEQPDNDGKPPAKPLDDKSPEKSPDPETQAEKGDQDDEGLDILLRGLGLPDRDLKKNLGCG